MYNSIMVPVDLQHIDQLEKSLAVAADLSKHFKASVCYVGVTGSQPSEIAHNTKEFEEKLGEFAAEKGKQLGIDATSKSYVGHDLVVDVDDVLLKAVEELKPDLVVMASHAPTIADYVWPSNGGKVAAHASISVFLVR